MKLHHDLKSFGLPPEPRPMPKALRTFCLGLAFVMLMLAAYAATVDAADRMVIMSRTEFDKTIAAERVKAATEAFTAAREDGECFMGWKRDPKPRRSAM